MEKAKVYYSDLRTSPTSNLLENGTLAEKGRHRATSFER